MQANEVKKVEQLEVVNLQLNGSHQFQFAGYYAAKEQGFYKEEGLDVNFRKLEKNNNVVKQVLLGSSNYGVGDAGIVFNYAKGDPIKAMAAIFQHNSLVFISKKSSEIISPFEMVGKRIMMKSSETDEAILNVIMADAEIPDQGYIPVKHNEKIEDFISGKVDVISGSITRIPFEIKQYGVEINIINPQSYGLDFYGGILFTSHQEIVQYPGRPKRFLRASLKGWRYVFNHQEELIQLIKNKYHSQLSIDQLRHEAEEIRKLVLPETIPLGQITEARLRNIADIYSRLNSVKAITENELTEFLFIKTNKLNLNEQELAWLQQNPIIKLGVAQSFRPYQWITEEGKFDGISADYLKLLEQRLGVEFEISKEKKAWPDVLKAAKQGEIDMLACVVKTPTREAYLNFSKPYLNSPAVIISEQSNGYIGTLRQLSNKHVAIQKGSYIQEFLAHDYPKIKITLTDTIKDALTMVSEGKVFAYVGDVTAASHMMKKEGFLNLFLSGSTPYESQFSFATIKDNPVLTSIMKKGLASISEDERNDIYNHWRALKVTQGIDIKTFVKYALGVFSLFLMFAYWVYRLRQSESALKRSEAKLQLILDTEPECVKVVDAEGFILQINQAGLAMLGINNVKDIVGRPVDCFIASEYKEAYRNLITRVLRGESTSLEYKVNGFDGVVRWMGAHAVPLVDPSTKSISILSVTNDITERKKIEEAQKIATLVYQNSSEAMMVLDKYNLIIAINPAFSKTTGYEFAEVEGMAPSLLFSNENESLEEEMKSSIEGNGHWHGETYIKHKKGELFPIRITINTIFTDKNKVDQRVALFSDITKQKETEKLIWDQANYDPLTGLPNRNMLLDHLKLDIKIANRSEKRLAVIFLDLDRFKEVNDTFGHEVGDELLCETATRLKSCLRKSDMVARLGGDEFIIILANLNETHNIDRVALDLINQLSKPFKINDEEIYVSASLGISLYPNDTRSAEGLIKYADQAMYLSKQRGRGCFNYFTQSMQDQAKSRMKVLNLLRQAIDENQFELYYQPIVNLKTGEIVKAEALIRWNHPHEGLVGPLDFISIAEDSGLIIEIGDWVFKEAAQQVMRWRKKYNKDFQITVNKSPLQFRAATNRDDWLNYLKEIGLTGNAIGIEITEGLLMDSSSNITYQLLQYRDAGIQVSLDDFGTGYSALSYLNKFDIDTLKIDRSFIFNLAPGSSDMALSEAIIVMSLKLGLKVVAEGIETEEQRRLLTEAGCDFGQGFLFSKPVSVERFEKLFKKNKLISEVLLNS
ncbi:MAG: EAL domain-containing protein [Methylococcaceae bacterium]|nr:EAL domain-containing protein [Methylococcaceae bacterium]